MYSPARICVLAACLAAVCWALPVDNKLDDPTPFSDCTGQPNVIPPWEGAGVVEKTVKNGMSVRVGSGNTSVVLLHLWGTPRERGVAHGELVREQAGPMYDAFNVWMEGQVDGFIHKYLPPAIVHIIGTKGVQAALEFVRVLTKKYTPQHFNEEMEGLAEGLQMDVDRVVRLHMFPELIRAACSMFGAWGEATEKSTNGSLIQLRALDWGADNPLRMYPSVLIYHSADPKVSANMAVLSWVGFLGAMTGVSDNMGISEKKWYTDAAKEFLPIGYPWNFLLRDILEFDRSLEQAESRISSAKKTAAIYVGIGSRADNSFVVEEYGVNTNVVFNDTTPFPGFRPMAEQHPLFKSIVYIDKHTQPSGQWCMAKVLEENYGKISAASAIELVSRLQTGDLHMGIYDFGNNAMYIGVASTNKDGPIVLAYDNQFIKLDLTTLFAVQKPQV